MMDDDDAALAANLDKVARAICSERCAYMGEPACYSMRDDQNRPLPWPNPNCDDPGCAVFAAVAIGTWQSLNTVETKP